MMQGQGYNLGRVKFRIITHIFIAKSLKLCTANCNISGRQDMFPQLHAVERQHFSEILAKDLAGARGTTAKVAFIPLLVLIVSIHNSNGQSCTYHEDIRNATDLEQQVWKGPEHS